MPEVSATAFEKLNELVDGFGLDAGELLARPDPGYGLKPDHHTRLTSGEVKERYPWLPDSCVGAVVAGHVTFNENSRLTPGRGSNFDVWDNTIPGVYCRPPGSSNNYAGTLGSEQFPNVESAFGFFADCRSSALLKLAQRCLGLAKKEEAVRLLENFQCPIVVGWQ